MRAKVTCDICKRRFDREGLMQHMQTVHYGDLPYDCTECGRLFSNMEAMRTHLQRHHSFTKD